MKRSAGLEMWGGIECTVNRVGDRYFEQLARSGHDRRPEDLDMIAALGVRKLRYPVLWEKTAPTGPGSEDWSWGDERLPRLRELAVDPIVGLLHHGSGPRHTSLVDPRFPALLAEFAGAVADRYAWVEHWTPVNEPLTTARFSGLYGLWYPHGSDMQTFLAALLNEVEGTIRSMHAIRGANPDARLVQTEDIGETHSTPLLQYQARHENRRRWWSLDLLCGKVDLNEKPWRDLPTRLSRQLGWILDNPCPPDIVGVNHYLTSERFLDERLDEYPAWSHGANGQHSYADVEAVRVRGAQLAGFEGVLRQAWERYQLPLAVTECHLGCSREEQVRWLADTWSAAQRLRGEGADIRAITAWSLLGAFDWHCLVTREEGRYEPGVFDCRGETPRPTALARAVATLARGQRPLHPALTSPGWWQREDRYFYEGRSEELEEAS